MKNAHNLCFVGVYYFTITCLQLIIQISVKKIKLFYVFNGLVGSGSSHFLIRIRIQGNDTDSMDPDPQHWAVVKIILLRVNFQKNMFVFILHISSLLLWEIPAEKGINIK